MRRILSLKKMRNHWRSRWRIKDLSSDLPHPTYVTWGQWSDSNVAFPHFSHSARMHAWQGNLEVRGHTIYGPIYFNRCSEPVGVSTTEWKRKMPQIGAQKAAEHHAQLSLVFNTLAPNHPQFLSSVYWICSPLPCHDPWLSGPPQGNTPSSSLLQVGALANLHRRREVLLLTQT